MSTSAPPLVVDASEWFVDATLREHVAARHWRRLPARAPIAIRLVMEALRPHGVAATFCVPAAVADAAPGLLDELRRAGHEVALSVRTTAPLDELDGDAREAAVASWRTERARLERALGVAVHGFAAAWPAGRGDGEQPWWRARLRELGFDYDATPARDAEGDAAAAVPLAGGGNGNGSEGGGAVAVRRFVAFRLDHGQPALMGLPKAVRAAHAASRCGDAELARVAADVGPPVAEALGLAMRAPSPPPARARSDAPAARADVPRLAVVVPLKDEADGVASLFVELDAVAEHLADVADCEFVVVDDGSTDRTWPLLEQLARGRRRVRLVRHEHNRGVAAAIRTGLKATDAELAASIDGDLSYDPMELRAMLALLERADVVTASPYHPRGAVRNVPEWRLLLSRTLSRAYRILLRSRVCTWTSCFRVYRRRAVVDLPLKNGGFLGTAELLVRVLRRGGRVVEHPCTLEARLLGFSKMRVFGTVIDHLRLLALVALRVVR